MVPSPSCQSCVDVQEPQACLVWISCAFATDLALSPPPPRLSSSPEAADSSSFDVQLGDIILTASDGLFDNMPDYMILQELKKLKVLLQEPKYFDRASAGVSFFWCVLISGSQL